MGIVCFNPRNSPLIIYIIVRYGSTDNSQFSLQYDGFMIGEIINVMNYGDRCQKGIKQLARYEKMV
jgi:hypothetical protein